MYFWTLLNKPEDKLAREVFEAQKQFKSKDCWVSQVEEDLNSCDIQLTEDKLKTMSKLKIKKIISSKIKLKAEEYLLKSKESHVKSKHIITTSDDPKEYFGTEKRLLFKLRTRMILIKGSFSSSNGTDIHCDLCDDDAEEETQMHLLESS